MCYHAYISPVSVRQTEWWLPQATSITTLPARAPPTSDGVRPWLVEPLPSWQ